MRKRFKMKETIPATFDSNLIFEVNEKVTAYNWFEKCAPYNFGTFIVKFREEDVLKEDENCRKIDTETMGLYNIGQYKVKKVLNHLAQITVFDRYEKRKEKNASK